VSTKIVNHKRHPPKFYLTSYRSTHINVRESCMIMKT